MTLFKKTLLKGGNYETSSDNWCWSGRSDAW